MNFHQDKPDVKSYLVYGEAVPYGKSVFVLRKNVNKGNVELWYPITGECFFFKWEQPAGGWFNFGAKPYMTYRVQDPVCPMKRVYSVVASDNIYSNIQKSDYPVLMNFNLTDTKSWKPLFVKEQP